MDTRFKFFIYQRERKLTENFILVSVYTKTSQQNQQVFDAIKCTLPRESFIKSGKFLRETKFLFQKI